MTYQNGDGGMGQSEKLTQNLQGSELWEEEDLQPGSLTLNERAQPTGKELQIFSITILQKSTLSRFLSFQQKGPKSIVDRIITWSKSISKNIIFGNTS